MLARPNSFQYFRCARTRASAPAVAAGKLPGEIVGLKPVMPHERFSQVERHLRVVGPPRLAISRTADEAPESAFEEAILMRCAEGVAKGEPEKAPGGLIVCQRHNCRPGHGGTPLVLSLREGLGISE